MTSQNTRPASVLALGSAQFGFDYGVTNSQGQVPLAEVKKILKKSQEISVNTVDTARLYGASESTLGQNPLNEFDIVTKFSIQASTEAAGTTISNIILRSLNTSLQNLNVQRVYGLLAHSADEFLAYPEDIMKAGDFLKREEKIKKFGVSVYNPEQIEKILKFYTPDLVQIPLNIFDQRFLLSGALDQLAKKNIEVHVRSAFLQGILLQKTTELHGFFSFCMDHFKSLDEFLLKNSLTRMQACLKFLSDLPQVSKIVVGVCSVDQLNEINSSLNNNTSIDPLDFSSYHSSDVRLINPLSWPMLKR